MGVKMSFYDEIEKSVRKAWQEDRRRVIREAVELGICFVAFIIAIILMFCW